MFFNSYRKKLVVLFVIIAIIPILIMSVSLNMEIRSHIINDGIKVRSQFINNETEKLDLWFRDKEKILGSIKENYPLLKNLIESENDFDSVNNYLINQIKVSQSFYNLYLTMEDGREYNSAFLVDDVNTRSRDWYRQTKVSKATTWIEPYTDITTGEKVITVAMPIFDERGVFQGVIGGDLRFEDVLNRLELIKIDSNATTYVVDNKDNIVASFGLNILDLNDTAKRYSQEIDRLYQNFLVTNNGISDITLDDKYIVMYSSLSTMDWKIASLSEEGVFFQNLTNFNINIIYTGLATLVLVISLAMMGSKLFSKPLEKLKQGTIEIENGNYDYRISFKKNDEFGRVAKAFNDMAQNLKESYESLKSKTQELLDSNKQLQTTILQLNASEDRYGVLIEHMYDFVWVINKGGRLVFLNNQVKPMLKYDKEELLGKNIISIIKPPEEGTERDVVQKLIENDYKHVEVTYIDKDRRDVKVELNTKRIFQNGELVAIQGVARDITDRKRMEKEIFKRNIELSTINKISKSLNSTLDLRAMLQNVADDIDKLMDVPMCDIRLLDDEGFLILMAKAGVLAKEVTSDIIHIEDSIIGEAVKNKNVYITNITKELKSYTHGSKDLINNGVSYINVIPFKTRGKVLGTLTVASREKLGSSNFNILMSLANQMTMVIENINLYQDLKENYLRTIETLAAAVEAKDKYTEGHSFRVSTYGYMIAKYMKLSNKACEEIKIAGILHDIGKIGISDAILTKPGKLTEIEYNAIAQHPMIGDRILESVGLSKTIMNCIRYHHKRYDLKGYPRDAKLEELPLEASIIGVADAFDAMTSSRSYRSPLTIDEAIQELRRNRGTQFHPYIVDVFLDIYDNNPVSIEEVIDKVSDARLKVI